MIEVQRYIEMFKEWPLLKPKEEREFLTFIRTPPEGVDVAEDGTWELTPEQRAKRDEFICRNIRLVIHTAKKFCKMEDPRMMDFISAGVSGMLHALDIFELEREVRFSTYANWWIQAKIRKEINVSDTKAIRHKTLYQNIKKLRNQHFREGRFVSDQDLYKELEWTEDKIAKYEEDTVRLKISLDTIDNSVTDFTAQDTALTVESPQDQLLEDMHHKEQLDLLHKSMGVLTKEQKLIVLAHYGLEGAEKTYDELAEDLGITREQVRRAEAQALAKLWRVMTTECPSLRE